jgi:uncharacterized protein YlxP (DUF503 family)
MYVGVCKVRLFLPDNQSLKGKRHVLRSIIQRVKNEFNVSIAEVEDQDLWQSAVLGICCVSNEAQHADEMLSRVVTFIEHNLRDAEMTRYETEIIPV